MVIEWMIKKIYPESLVTDRFDDPIKQDTDISILNNDRYLKTYMKAILGGIAFE